MPEEQIVKFKIQEMMLALTDEYSGYLFICSLASQHNGSYMGLFAGTGNAHEKEVLIYKHTYLIEARGLAKVKIPMR